MTASASSQEELFRFLATPATHGLDGTVVQIDTHGAAVFLAGRDAYKIKRAVRFPFMDFSTLELRRKACEAELAVNRPHAPDLYLGLVPITREADGRLALGGSGEVVEWAVHLRRFDEHETLDLVCARGRFSPQLIPKVAGAVLKYHSGAEVRTGDRATEALHGVMEETLQELLAAGPLFGAERSARFCAALRKAFSDHRRLLLQRERRGDVRRCHGDLHLRNIALIGGDPVIFDAIEFDESLAVIDVFYDLAFLLMDLWERGLRSEANLCLNRYLWASSDPYACMKGLALLPLFLSLRAAIRAKVAILQGSGAESRQRCEVEAQGYFDAAFAFLEPRPTTVIAIGGLSGTGKTTLALASATALGRAPGAVVLRSDIERKRLFGIAETERLPPSAYNSAAARRCYEALRRQAVAAIRAGHCVIVDAVHARQGERRDVRTLARKAGARFLGLWLEAPLAERLQRVAHRKGDASDATPDVVMDQNSFDIGRLDWITLDASRPLEQTQAVVEALLQMREGGDPAGDVLPPS